MAVTPVGERTRYEIDDGKYNAGFSYTYSLEEWAPKTSVNTELDMIRCIE